MKRILLLSLCLVVVALPLIGCSDKTSEPSAQATSATVTTASQPVFQSIPPSAAKQLMAKKKNLLIVDVRSPQELREGKIAGSILVPFWNIFKGKHNLPRDRPLLLVCAVGGRSYAVGQLLAKQGYPELYNMSGGMAAWKKAGLPVVY